LVGGREPCESLRNRFRDGAGSVACNVCDDYEASRESRWIRPFFHKDPGDISADKWGRGA
jgi:hypothetical protein